MLFVYLKHNFVVHCKSVKTASFQNVYRINIEYIQPTQAFTSVELMTSEISSILHFFCTMFKESLGIREKKGIKLFTHH